MISRAEVECQVFMKGRNIRTFPIDIEEAVNKLNVGKPVNVLYDKTIPDEIGAYTYEGKNKIFIIINSQHPPRRQRFSGAHEIAHLFFGHKELSLHTWHDTCDNYQELEADEFAAALLMPSYEMYHLASYCRDIVKLINVVQIFFDVSLSAASQRIANLEIFEGAIILKNGYRTCFSYSSPSFIQGSGYKEKIQKRLISGKILYIYIAETYRQLLGVE